MPKKTDTDCFIETLSSIALQTTNFLIIYKCYLKFIFSLAGVGRLWGRGRTIELFFLILRRSNEQQKISLEDGGIGSLIIINISIITYHIIFCSLLYEAIL